MPYPIAHPAVAVPLHRLLGRSSVPSALALGTVVPDVWYVLPWFERADSHTGLGLLEFCLPVGLIAYLLFHLVKMPVLELLPRAFAERLRAYACEGLPRAAWWAVCLCIVIGAATHLAWDSLTHDDAYGRIVRHGSTIFGGAFVLWWVARKVREATPVAVTPQLSAFWRRAVIVTIAGLGAATAAYTASTMLPAAHLDYQTARGLARTAGIESVAVLAWATIAYGLVWRLLARRSRSAS